MACAAAVAALTAIEEEDLAGQAAAKGKYLMDKLKKINLRTFVKCAEWGLMVGIEMKQKVVPYIRELQDLHIIALNAGMTVVRLLPPLVITYQQIDHLVDVLSEVLSLKSGKRRKLVMTETNFSTLIGLVSQYSPFRSRTRRGGMAGRAHEGSRLSQRRLLTMLVMQLELWETGPSRLCYWVILILCPEKSPCM